MPASSYVVTPSGDLKPPRRPRALTLSPRRLASACRQLLDPLGSFDPATIRLDARAIDAELMGHFTYGGPYTEATGNVAHFTRTN